MDFSVPAFQNWDLELQTAVNFISEGKIADQTDVTFDKVPAKTRPCLNGWYCPLCCRSWQEVKTGTRIQGKILAFLRSFPDFDA